MVMSELHPTASRLVENAVALIEESGGSKGVNLRMIAKRVGCAHTNVYNYFDSFEDLLWGAFLAILKRWVEFTRARVGAQVDQPGLLRAFVQTQVAFAVEHPGWYRFVWLEKLPGQPPPPVLELLNVLRTNFTRRLVAGSTISS